MAEPVNVVEAEVVVIEVGDAVKVELDAEVDVDVDVGLRGLKGSLAFQSCSGF